MKLSKETKWLEVNQNWSMLGRSHTLRELMDGVKVVDRHGERVDITDHYQMYKDPTSSSLAFRIKKDHWAKGRKMRIESKLPFIPTGEYVITWKAQSNSYDKDDFLVVEYIHVELKTPKQALSWLEDQVAEMEKRDGLTTAKIIREMKVRG